MTEYDDEDIIEAEETPLKDLEDGEAFPEAPGEQPAREPAIISGSHKDLIELTLRAINPALERVHPGLPLNQEEIGILAEAWAPVLEKYLPTGATYNPWVGAIFATVAVVAPRVPIILSRHETRRENYSDRNNKPQPAQQAQQSETLRKLLEGEENQE
jgi:hypothetical protein